MRNSTHRGIVSRSFEYQNNKLFSLCDALALTRNLFLLLVASVYIWLCVGVAQARQKPDLSIAVAVGEGKSTPAQQPSDHLMKALVTKAMKDTDKDRNGDVVTLSWETIFPDGFEGLWYWTTYGYPTWRDTSYRSNTGSWSAWCADDGLSPPGPYASNMDAWMIYGPFDLSDADDARVTFWYWLDSESDYDYFWWFSSGDGTNFSGDRISGYFPYWQPKTFSLSNHLGDSSVWFAFNFDSDSSYQYEGAYVDDVVIEKCVSTLPDIVVERLYVSPSSSVSGTPVKATVKVTNRGGVAAGAFDVDFYKNRASAPGSGDAGDHTWNVSSLDDGNSTTLTWDFNTPGNGSYNAWAQVDRTNAVIESDDMNNKKGPFLYKVEEPGDVTYYAVICGIAEYPEPISDLVWTDDDANDINDTLVQYPEWSSGNIQLLIDSQATKSAIKAAVETMRQQADANDICLFFMSGHGTTGPDEFPFDESDDVDEYLVSCDAGGLSDWISDDEFGEWFEAFPAPVTVLLDTCFSGGQIRELADANLAVRSFSVGYPSPAKGDGFATDIALALGLEKFGKRDLDDTLTAGGVVVTAADDDESSWGSGALENGVFTEYVLEALDGERETADTNDDGDVSAEEVYDYAAPRATQYCIDHGMEPPQHAQLYDNYPPDSPSLDDLTVVAPIPGDFEPDGDVDMDDLAVLCDQWLLAELSADVAPIEGGSFVDFLDWAVFANAWQSTPSSPNWNPKCDIAPEEGDDIVDLNDLAVFADQWLQFGAYCADIAPAPEGDGVVNLLDFAVFAENWLEGTNP